MMAPVPFRRASLALVVALGLAGCGDTPSPPPAVAPTTTAAPSPPPPKPTDDLTVAQLAGQHLIASFRGTSKPPAALVRRIRRGEVAGVILFAENASTVAQARRLVRRLQAIPRPQGLRDPLLIMVDQEGGGVRRLRDAPPVRSASTLSGAGERAVRFAGRATGRALRAAGVNVDLAPVADLARVGGAMAAERRTFGTNTVPVGRLTAAFAAGLRSGGVLAGIKHFPGLGAATSNTDDRVVRIGLSAPTLRSRDEAAFAPAIREGVPLVMLANARYPALDPRWPASLSRAVIADELRGRLGFRGVTVTDDLEANALRPFGSPGQLAARGVRAGVDLLLYARSYGATEGALQSLRGVPRRLLEPGARRVLALRASLGR
jgi:beta-N-acetylhexosaminidase